MRRRRDHQTATTRAVVDSQSKVISINHKRDKFRRHRDDETSQIVQDKARQPDVLLRSNQINDDKTTMIRWSRLDDKVHDEEVHEMNDYKYVQHLAHKTSRRSRRQWRRTHSQSRWTIPLGNRARTKLSKARHFRVRSFIMKKLSTLSQILFMFICLALISSASISTRQPWASCEQTPATTALTNSSISDSEPEIQRSPRAAASSGSVLATTQRRARQQTARQQTQTTTTATNKSVDSALFDIERKPPQTGDNRNSSSSSSGGNAAVARTSGNYGDKQQQQHDDLSGLSSIVDLNLTNSIDFNSAAGSLSSSANSIVVLDSGRPKYENYPIDPSARFDPAVQQSPFASDESAFSAHASSGHTSSADDGGSGEIMDAAVSRTVDRQRAHDVVGSADVALSEWRQTNTTGKQRVFLDASLEAQAKLRDTVQQLHYNKSLGFERTTRLAARVDNSSTSGTPLLPLEPARYQTDQSNLLPLDASNQLVSVSPTGAPSQLIEYVNSPAAGRDPLETAASAGEARQRQHGSDWGRRKSPLATATSATDQELASETTATTTSEDQQMRSAVGPAPSSSSSSSSYEDIVTWTPAAGPAAYRAGSGFQPAASSSQRADINSTGSEEAGGESQVSTGSELQAEPESNPVQAPNENFYAPATKYRSLAINLNATRRSDGTDSDAPLVPVASAAASPDRELKSTSPGKRGKHATRASSMAFKTRAPRVQPRPPVTGNPRNNSLAPAYANNQAREHFGSDEADSRQSARYSDLAGREPTSPGRRQRPGSPDAPEEQPPLDRADSSDFDERPITSTKAKRKKLKSKRVNAKPAQESESLESEPEPERNSIDESEAEDTTRDGPQASRKVEMGEPNQGDQEDQEQDELPEEHEVQASSTTPKPSPSVVGGRKRAPPGNKHVQQVVSGANVPKVHLERKWKQKHSKHKELAHAGDRTQQQWSQLDVSGSSTIKAASAADANQPARPPVIRTFRLAEPNGFHGPLLESPPAPPVKPAVNLQVDDSNARINTQGGLYVAPRAFSSLGAAGPVEQSNYQSIEAARGQGASTSFRPLLAPVSQFQAIPRQQQQQQQQAYALASASTNQLNQSPELIDHRQQQQRQNWSVVVLPYPKPVENAQNYFGALPLSARQPASAQQRQQHAFNVAAESAAQHYSAAAPPIVWPTAPANEIGQQLAVLRRQHELMQQQQQQMVASGANKLIQRGTRQAPGEMRAPADNTLTINLSTHATAAIGPNQLFWEAAAREAAAQQQQQQQQRDSHKLPVSNGHTPPQHRESRQSLAASSSTSNLPMMRRPLAAMRQQHLNAFGGDQAGSAPGGSVVYPNEAYTNGHAYAGSTLKGPQLAAALDSLRSFNEFAHFQQASSNEFAFADPMANANHFYSFAGANPFESPQQQQQQVAATDAFTSLLQQSGYGPAASFFPTNAQASAMAGAGGQTNNNSQFVKKGSAQLIASTPPMATPAGVRDPFGWPLAYGSQAAKSLLQINQVAPAPNYLIPGDKLKELAATSQQQQKSLRPTIESVQDLPSATSWNPNQALAAAFPLWAAASAPAPVTVARPSSPSGGNAGSDLAVAASSSGPQNVVRVQISTRAPSRRERFWKRLRLFRRSLAGGGSGEASGTENAQQSGDNIAALTRRKRSTTFREQLVKRPPVVRLMESWRHLRATNRSTTPTGIKPAPNWPDLGVAESQQSKPIVASPQPPPPKLAMIEQDEPASGTRTAFIPLLDTSNLLDNLESDLLAQALLFSQRQHMQRGRPPAPTNNGQLFQQLESAPRAQFLLPAAHSMQMVSHTPLYPAANGPADASAPDHEYHQLLASNSFRGQPEPYQSYGMLMQAAASMASASDGQQQHLEPPANEPGSVALTNNQHNRDQQGPRARIKQLSSQLMRQSRKPLTKLMQMANFTTSRFSVPAASALKSAVSVQANMTGGTQMATSASSVRATAQKQLPYKMPLAGHFGQVNNHLFDYQPPLMMSHYLGGANAGTGAMGPYQEMLMMMNQVAMQPPVLFSPATGGRLNVPFAGQQRRPPTQSTIYAPRVVGATVIAGNRTHSMGNSPLSGSSSNLVRFAEMPTPPLARLFAPANAPQSNQVLVGGGGPSQRAHERADDEISQLISGLKMIKQSLHEKSSELTGGDALRRASNAHHQFQFSPSPTIDFRSHHHPHQHAHHLQQQVAASRRQQQVKVSPTLRIAQPQQQQHQFVRQVSTSPSFKFVSAPPPLRAHNQRTNDEQAALMAAAAAAASQHEHDFSSYLGNFPQHQPPPPPVGNYTDAEIFSSPSDQQPVELQVANGANELALDSNSLGSDEQQQQQQNMMALDDQTTNSLLTGTSKLEDEQQQQLINQQTQQQPTQQMSGGNNNNNNNFVSQDEAQFQQQQQNAFLQMQQYGGGGGGGGNANNLPRPRLPKFSIPSINSITNKFRQHLYQAFKLNPMGSGGSSRWPTMLASPASYISYQQQQQQPSGFANYPIQQQQQQPAQQIVNLRPAGVQVQNQAQQSSFNMEPSASNYYDVTRQPPAHFQAQEFSMGHQQPQRVQMVRPSMMQQQSQPMMNSNRMPRQQQTMMMGQVQAPMQQQMYVSSAPNPMMNNNNNNNNRQQQYNSISLTDQYGNNLLNQTTETIGVNPYQQQVVVGEQTIYDNEIVGLDMVSNGTQAMLITGNNNLTMASQQQEELFNNQTLTTQVLDSEPNHQPPSSLQGVLTELNGNQLVASDETYAQVQEDQLELANQHGGGKMTSDHQPESDQQASSQTRQPEESQQQENIAIKGHDQQQVVVDGAASNQRARGGPETMYDQQQLLANNNTSGTLEDQEQHSQVALMLEPSGGQQQQHYELERVVTTVNNLTNVRSPSPGGARPAKPSRPSLSRPGQRHRQASSAQQQQQHREVDYQVIRASSDVSASQQQGQSYMDVPQIVHLSNGTIDNQRQVGKRLHSPLFKHAATRPVVMHQHQQHRENQLQRQSTAANDTQQQDSHEATQTSDRFIVPTIEEEREIDPNSIEHHDHNQRLHQLQDGAELLQQQQPAQILHGTNQILNAAIGQDQADQYRGHSSSSSLSMADNEVEQQLDNQLAGRPLNWRINATGPTGGGRQNASLQYDFRPVDWSESTSSHNSSAGQQPPSHEQFVLIDQPVILTGQSSQVESSQHIQYSQVNESSQTQQVATSKLDFEPNILSPPNSNSSMSGVGGSEQPAVFVSIKPERVLQSSTASPSPKHTGGSQQQNRKRPLKMPKRAPANLQQLAQLDQRASESSGASLRTNRPPGLIVAPFNATTTISSTTTTTSTTTTSRPTQASRRPGDTRNHNYKSASSLKDSYTRAPKARIRWQGAAAHHSTALGNETSSRISVNNSAGNDTQAAWIINGMTHQAYAPSARPNTVGDSTQETSVTISQVPFNSSSTQLVAAAANHNYGYGAAANNRTTTTPGGQQSRANHKLAAAATHAGESTGNRVMPANHRAISSEPASGESSSSSKGRSDSRTGSTSFKLSSGGGAGSNSHSAPALDASAPANLSSSTTTTTTTQPPARANQLIDDSFLLASATESSQVALDQMLAAASGPTTNTTIAADAHQPAIVRRSEPTEGQATSGNQTTLSMDQQQDQEQTTTTAFDDAETFYAGDWAREFANARSEGEPRIHSLAAAAAGGKLQPGEQLPLAVRIRMRQQQQQQQEDQELEATTAAARLLSQSNEPGNMDDATMMMKHAADR